MSRSPMHNYGVCVECKHGNTQHIPMRVTEHEIHHIIYDLLDDPHITDIFVYEDGVLIACTVLDSTDAME